MKIENEKELEYNVTYRPKNKGWQCIVSYKNENDEWKQKSKQGFKTKRDSKPYADKIINELIKQMDSKKKIVNESYDTITFKELSDAFINHEKLYKEHNTIKGYKNAISAFSDLNDIEVCRIKKMYIINCVDKLIGKLKVETIRTYLNRVKLIFSYYIDNYDPNYKNPIKDIKLPKDTGEPSKIALANVVVNKLLKALEGTRYYIVAYIAAKTGLRCGEILGLTWNDINKKDMYISVNKQWKVLKSGKSGFGSLKTKNSNRNVPISKDILRELEKYRKYTPMTLDNRIAPFNKASIEKYLNPKLRELAGISMHELRHTYATILIANGLDFKTVAKILGHTVEMTLRTYSHVTDDMMKKASEKISKIF